MVRKLMSLLVVATLSLTVACDKSGEAATEGGAAEEQAEETTPAEEGGEEAAEKGGDEAAEKGGEEPIICCEFGGAIGTSTASKCAEHDGKVVEDLEPPCKK